MNSTLHTRSLGRVIGRLAPVSAAVQALSLLSSVVLAHVLGASAETDAYFIGLSAPVLVYAVVLAGVRLGAVPALTEVASASGRTELARVGGQLVSAVVAAAALLSIVVTAAAYTLVPLLLASDPELIDTSRTTALELAPLGVFGALTGVLGAILAVRGVFAPALAAMAFEPLLKTALTLALGETIGIHALIAGNLLGSASAATLLWMVVRRCGIPLRPRRPRNTVFLRNCAALSLPLLVSQAVLQMNPVVDRVMASGLGAGSVTAFELGVRLFLVPTGVLGAVLVGPIAATWASRKSEGGWEALRASVQRAVASVVAVAVPPIGVIFVLRGDLAAAIFAGGAFPANAVRDTAAVFGMLALGLPAQVLVVAYATLFVVQKDAVFPMLMGLANVILNVGLNYALRPFLGVAGIALSTTITLSFLGAVMVVEAERRWSPLSFGHLRPALLSGAASLTVLSAASVGLLGILPGASTRLEHLVTVVVVGSVGAGAHTLVLTLSRNWRPDPARIVNYLMRARA